MQAIIPPLRGLRPVAIVDLAQSAEAICHGSRVTRPPVTVEVHAPPGRVHALLALYQDSPERRTYWQVPVPVLRTYYPFHLVRDLVHNACDSYHGCPGVVHVTVSRARYEHHEPWGPADVGILAAGDYVRLDVTDAGSGMSDETLARIYDHRWTTRAGQAHAFGGRGIGMTYVRGAVEYLGGAMRIQSTLGAGTTVSVFVPACAAPAATHAVDIRVGEPTDSRGPVSLSLVPVPPPTQHRIVGL